MSIHWLGWRSLSVSSQWFLIDLHIVVLIHWLVCRTVRVSSQWFLLDLHIVCVNTLIGLEKPQSFITVVLHPSGSIYCLCWYTDWVGEPSAFHNSGSYLIYISSVSIHWLGCKSLRVSSQWFLLDLHFVCVDTLIGLENHHRFITVVLTWSSFSLCWYTDWVGEQSPFYNSGSY